MVRLNDNLSSLTFHREYLPKIVNTISFSLSTQHQLQFLTRKVLFQAFFWYSCRIWYFDFLQGLKQSLLHEFSIYERNFIANGPEVIAKTKKSHRGKIFKKFATAFLIKLQRSDNSWNMMQPCKKL